MRRVHVRVQEGHRDRFDLLTRERVGDAREIGLGQGRDDRAVGGDALGDLEAEPAFHQRLRLAVGDVVKPWRAEAADLEHVAEAARGDERDARALSLDDGVGRHRGGMHELADLLRLHR